MSAQTREQRVRARLAVVRDLVDPRLAETLALRDGLPGSLHAAMAHALLGGGKRLRPALVLAAAEACAGDESAALPGALAVELIHAYSLVHDDLPAMDDDDLRRGQPTVHKQYGEALAILAGDALQTLAFETIAQGPAPAELRLAATRVLAVGAGAVGMVAGQVLDLEAEGRPTELVAVREIHSRKTAALIAASVEIGARLAGAPEATATGLAAFGREIGLAFQIIDDCLDETATATELGKTAGKDRAAGKATWPACVGLTEARAQARNLVGAACETLRSARAVDLEASFLQDLSLFVVERRA